MSGLADRIRAVVGHQASRIGAASGAAASDVRGDLTPLGGEWSDGVFVVERRYDASARHGRETVGAIAARLADASAYASYFTGQAGQDGSAADAAPPFVFFDLETTGLSGGAGTQAFLVGCGSFDADGSFVIRQFVLPSPSDERRMLDRVQTTLDAAGALVSFNGKSFDAPLLETRYLFHRLAWDRARRPHLDVLHPARRFWGASRGPQAGDADCSLVALERHVVGARRTDDVPGAEVPARYFQFVRTGNARPLVPVLEHNRLDLLSLAALTARLLHLVRIGPAGAASAREALALGQVFVRAGLEPQAGEAFERSLALCAAPSGAYDPTRIEALRALALTWRRARQFQRAAERWHELLRTRGCPAVVVREAAEALAIHHEHRLRDLEAARAFARRGLDGEREPPPASWTRAVRHRLARLDRKLGVGEPARLPLPDGLETAERSTPARREDAVRWR